MTIRKATNSDIPQIVQVLKASLGEKDLPLSEEIWKFKHEDNPFGRSLVLVALEENAIVGVRAFMKWHLHLKDKKFSCYRAVDTSTHPAHQGKGIFKKLTLKAVEIAKAEHNSFVFNFPNNKSRPGYLKMGWKSAGKIEVAVKPSLNSFWKISNKPNTFQVEYKTTPDVIENLCKKWNTTIKAKEGLYTSKSHRYLEWRYEKNPLQKYEVLATENFYLSATVKKRKSIKELRITECIYADSSKRREINRIIRRWGFKFGVQVISFSPKVLEMSLPFLKGKLGPVLTVRDLNLNPLEKAEFLEINNWNYSLGDMELF